MTNRSPTPEELTQLPPRVILEQGQIDRTPHHDVAIRWLHGARIRGPEIADDPSFMGEAAALLAIRNELAGASESTAEHWLVAAKMELDQPGIPPREFATAAIAACRVAGTRLYKGSAVPTDINRAAVWSDQANHVLSAHHQPGKPWDRYATMLDKHQAIMELLDNRSIPAATIALRGIWRATRADDEGQPYDEHRAFVAKQRQQNYHVFRLAAVPHRHDIYTFVAPRGYELYELLGRPLVHGYTLEPHG